MLAYHYDSLTPYRSKHFLKLDSNFESDFRIRIVPELAYEEFFLTSHTNLKHYFIIFLGNNWILVDNQARMIEICRFWLDRVGRKWTVESLDFEMKK